MSKVTFKIIIALFVCVFYLLSNSCKTTETLSVSKVNVAGIYNPTSSNIFPEYTSYHVNDSVSTIYIRVDTRQLTYTKADKALLEITYILYKSLQQNIIADSSTYKYEVEKNDEMPFLTLNVNLKTSDSIHYICELRLTDMIKRRPRQFFVEIDRSNKQNCLNYLLYSKEFNEPFYRNYFYKGEKFTVRKPNATSDSLLVSYYEYEVPMPPPPFSTKAYKTTFPKADSSLLFQNSKSLEFEQMAAIMFFRPDSNVQNGYASFKYHEYFPNVKTAFELIRPLRYMATAKEYRELEMAPVKKDALDEFWLKVAGNEGKAKELIKVYYNRVIFSNVYFTSITEGWRTDRGMIYIIFGPPKQVYKFDSKEKWSYGEVQGMRSLDFVFDRVDNPYAQNHYVLERSEKYTSVWIDALGSWRRGKIYFYGQ